MTIKTCDKCGANIIKNPAANLKLPTFTIFKFENYIAGFQKKCYRAQLTKDLRERPNLFFLPISWANFKGTEECPMIKEVPVNA